MKLLRIDHVGVVVDDLAAHVDQLEALGLSPVLEARRLAVSWPPFPSGPTQMIWTDGESSGGVRYQFRVRPERGG